MRKYLKFKNYKRFENVSCAHLLSFYNLKRTKWALVQRRLAGAAARKRRSKVKPLNLFRVKRDTRFWGKISNQHRQHQSLITKVGMSYSNSLNNKFYSNHSKNYQHKLLNVFIKFSLKLDVLLWLSGFFFNTKVARLNILLGNIYLNNRQIFHPFFLKKNDTIQFKDLASNLKLGVKLSSFFFNASLFKIKKLTIKKFILIKKKSKFKRKTFFFQFKKKYSLSLSKIKKVLIVKKRRSSLSRHIFSFLEVDLYSKRFVVIKDFNCFSSTDICLSAKEYFDVQQF